MIVCDKCGSHIEDEPAQAEENAAQDKTEDGKRKYNNKAKAKEEAPLKRQSLVLMPYGRAAGGFSYREIDLCTACRASLEKELDKVKFAFLTGG